MAGNQERPHAEAEEAPACDHAGDDGEHEHAVAHPQEWPWLKKLGHGDLAKHPYCEKCGTVRVVGPERAMKLGGLVNLLASVERLAAQDGRKITEAQKRLIIKRLQKAGAHDHFGLTRTSQLSLFIDTVAGLTGLSPHYLEGRLQALGVHTKTVGHKGHA